jgi:hypothetical protein
MDPVFPAILSINIPIVILDGKALGLMITSRLNFKIIIFKIT